MNAKQKHSTITILCFSINFALAHAYARKLEGSSSEEENEPEEANSLGLYMIILAVIIAVILLVSSVYYKRHLDYYGFPPFEVPTFAPKFIFPRPSVDPLLRSTVDRNLELIFRRDSL